MANRLLWCFTNTRTPIYHSALSIRFRWALYVQIFFSSKKVSYHSKSTICEQNWCWFTQNTFLRTVLNLDNACSWTRFGNEENTLFCAVAEICYTQNSLLKRIVGTERRDSALSIVKHRRRWLGMVLRHNSAVPSRFPPVPTFFPWIYKIDPRASRVQNATHVWPLPSVREKFRVIRKNSG